MIASYNISTVLPGLLQPKRNRLIERLWFRGTVPSWVVRVHVKDGEEDWVLVHVEIQGQKDGGIEYLATTGLRL
jgi:hypothetical protein